MASSSSNPDHVQESDHQDQNVTYFSNLLKEVEANLFSDDKSLVQRAAEALHNKILAAKIPSIHMVRAGLIPRLVELLQDDRYPVIQFEVAWALTNIASDPSSDSSTVVDANACPHLIRSLSSSKSEDVREQCAWALGVIAADSLTTRDMLLKMDALPALIEIFNSEMSRISTIRRTTWTLSKIFHQNPAPSDENIALALPYLAKLIHSHDIKTASHACVTLSYISGGSDTAIQMVLDQEGVMSKFAEILKSDCDGKLLIPGLRTVGNIVTGNDDQTMQVIELGFLPALTHLLSHKTKKIRMETCWAFSNITAGTKDQIQAVFECEGAIAKLIDCLKSDEYDVQKEACWAISNITSGGTEDNVLGIAITTGSITALCNMLFAQDNSVIQVALEGLQNILLNSFIGSLELDFSYNDHSTLSELLRPMANDLKDGLAKISILRGHDLLVIHKLSSSIIVGFYDFAIRISVDTSHVHKLLGDIDANEHLDVANEYNRKDIVALLLSRGNNFSNIQYVGKKTRETFEYWPLMMLILVLKELKMYNSMDFSSLVDFWQFIFENKYEDILIEDEI